MCFVFVLQGLTQCSLGGAGVSVSPVSALDGCLKGLFALQGACCEAPSLPSWALSFLDQANSVA